MKTIAATILLAILGAGQAAAETKPPTLRCVTVQPASPRYDIRVCPTRSRPSLPAYLVWDTKADKLVPYGVYRTVSAARVRVDRLEGRA